MKKALKFTVIIIAALVLLASIAAASIFSSPTTVAYLYLENGDVQVDQGSGFTQAINEMALDVGDTVKTSNGQATIVFFESEVMTLEPNSQVTIKTLEKGTVEITQESGTTWNRVAKLTGTKQYTVETPTSIATVRGTSFNLQAADQDTLDVGDGTVWFEDKSSKQGDNFNQLERATINNAAPVRAKSDPIFLAKKIQHDVQMLNEIRWREIQKHPILFKQIKTKLKASDEDIQRYFAKVEIGEITREQVEANIPMKTPSVKKVIALTFKIKQLNQEIRKLNEIQR